MGITVDMSTLKIPAHYNDYGGGNHFYPLPISPEGIQYSHDGIRNEDHGESPDSVLDWNWYFKWGTLPYDYRNVDNVTWRIDLAGENLDLKGGGAYAFVVVVDWVNGVQPPSSGRYWLMSRPLSVGSFAAPMPNIFSVPSSSGWVCTFSRAGAISNAPSSPDLRYIECIGLGFKGYNSLPTGKFGCRLFQID